MQNAVADEDGASDERCIDCVLDIGGGDAPGIVGRRRRRIIKRDIVEALRYMDDLGRSHASREIRIISAQDD